MLDRLLSILGHGPGPAEPAPVDHQTLCAAVLLVYAARLDGQLDDAERETVSDLLQRRFELSGSAVASLIEVADRRAAEVVDLYSLTRDIKDAISLEDRIRLIEMLWEVVYADGLANDYETNLVRRVCGLLYVSDVDSGAARKRVSERLGLERS
jgi:Uncharacterized protein conserved in bacteria